MGKVSDGFFSRKDKRSAARRSLGSDAWVKIGGLATRRCVIADVSSSGVRLIVDVSVPIPREFELITAKGAPGRKCAIKWRNATQLGAAFV
jgi:hypothetical protein